MTPLEAAAFVLVALAGTAVALERNPKCQVVALSFMGLALTLLFVVLQAPEVALSELAVGGVLVPLLFLASLARAAQRREP